MRVRTRANHKKLTFFLENSSTTRLIGTLVQPMILRVFEIDSLVSKSILRMAMVLRRINLLSFIGLYN